MSRKPLLIWILLLLVIAVLKTSASGTGHEMINSDDDEDQQGTNLNDEGVHDEDGDNDDEEEGEDEEEQHAQPQDYGLEDFLTQNTYPDPSALVANIIGGAFNRLSEGLLTSLPPDHLFNLLEHPVGARLAAAHPFGIFTQANAEVLFIDCVNEEFFVNLDLFSNRVSFGDLSLVPASFVIKTIQIHSRDKKFNLKGFIEKFENFDQTLSFEMPVTLGLPHLFDLPLMHNPVYFMGRGVSFEACTSDKDKIIWDISLKLFLHRLLNEESFKTSEDASEMLHIVKQEIASCRRQPSQEIDYNFNYFGLEDTENFNIVEDFQTPKLFTLEEREITLVDLSTALGFPDFMAVNYESLSVEDRIVYRLIIYVSIYNPTLLPKAVRNDLIANFLRVVPSRDFTDAEFDFFVSACIKNKMGGLITTVFRDFLSADFRKEVEIKMIGCVNTFKLVVNSITNEMDKLIFLKRGTNYFNTALRIENEEFYRIRQADRPVGQSQTSANAMIIVEPVVDEEAPTLIRTKRLRNGDQAPECHFSSHFLSEEQVQNFGPVSNAGNGNSRKTFVLPYPNKEFFLARFDNLMQNLHSADLGEIEWKKHVQTLEEHVIRAYEQHEKDLDEFVRLTFQVVDYMRTYPSSIVSVKFRGSPSHGEGLKMEALETFARAILLPRFKVFCYNAELRGFLPYPLLHQDIMASLGYLNRWFLDNGMPLNWQFSEKYLEFLFYQEDPFESMQSLIESYYEVIFMNLEELKAPGISPLDYFTSSFYPHQPLAFQGNDIYSISPLDLFSPVEPSCYTTLFVYLDQEQIDFLAEMIEPPKPRKAEEESKVESSNLIESKDDCDEHKTEMESQSTFVDEDLPYYMQLEMKVEIIETLKQAASHEIIQFLLLGRFAFIRNFMPVFNSFSQEYITASLYSCLQNAQAKEITAEILISGLNFSDERADIQIFDEQGSVYTPRQALEYILRHLPQEMMKTFYWFCTGCTSLPLGPLSTNPIGVNIYQVDRLPSSRTCFRSLNFNLKPGLDLNGHLEAMRKALMESTGFNAEEGINVENQVVGVFVDVPVNDQTEPGNANEMEAVQVNIAIDPINGAETTGTETVGPVGNTLNIQPDDIVIDLAESTSDDD